jgi:hypothetical protein
MNTSLAHVIEKEVLNPMRTEVVPAGMNSALDIPG